MSHSGSNRRALALATGLFALALAHTMAAGIDEADELWFLRVTQRVAEGEVLYRDVFFGTTPLSVWLGAGLVAVVGAEVVAVKAIVGAAAAVCGVAAASVMRSLGASGRAAVIVAVLVVAVPGPAPAAAYQWLAAAFALAALAAVLRWRGPAGSPRPLAIAGVLVGLSVATKHSTGALAALALVVAIAALAGRGSPPRAIVRGVLISALAATLVQVGVMAPVVLGGATAEFTEYAVTAKDTYLRAVRGSYLTEIAAADDTVERLYDGPALATADAVMVRAGYFALPLALVALLVGIGRRGPPVVVVTAFTVAAAATLYPITGTAHMTFVMPAVGLASAVAAHVLLRERRWRRRVRLAAAGAALGLVAVSVLVPVARLVRGSAVVSDVPHLRGVLLPPRDEAVLAADRRALLDLRRRHGTVLMLGAQAAKAQLLGEFASATPFDYPWITAMGHNGDAETAAAIRAGRIRAACLTTPPGHALAPPQVEAAVLEALPRRGDRGACTLYAR